MRAGMKTTTPRTAFASSLTLPFLLAAASISLGCAAPDAETAGSDGDVAVTQEAVVAGQRKLAPVASGGAHSCAATATGTVSCWGANDRGQLGNGLTADSPLPVAVSGLTRIVGVSAGDAHTCAVTAAGAVHCWGENGSGQLGDTTTTQRSTPVQVAGITSAVLVTAGGNHTCALLSDGGARCWGNNNAGQLGNGTTITNLAPVAVSNPSPYYFTALAAGGAHTCGALSDGTALCWGSNASGQLGNNSLAASSATPVGVASLGGVTTISAAASHTCATQTAGEVHCWGDNRYGQLGRSDKAPDLISSGATSITAGDYHTCATTSAGQVLCWGLNSTGQIGDNTTNTALTPRVTADLAYAVAVVAGADHTCALYDDGSVPCWGGNGSGQLGFAGGSYAVWPNFSGVEGAVALAAGKGFTCAARRDGTVSCWGANASGQKGLGYVDGATYIPTQVIQLSGVTSIEAGGAHACATLATGKTACWGRGEEGQLGDGAMVTQTKPVAVANLP